MRPAPKSGVKGVVSACCPTREGGFLILLAGGSHARSAKAITIGARVLVRDGIAERVA